MNQRYRQYIKIANLYIKHENRETAYFYVLDRLMAIIRKGEMSK